MQECTQNLESLWRPLRPGEKTHASQRRNEQIVRNLQNQQCFDTGAEA